MTPKFFSSPNYVSTFKVDFINGITGVTTNLVTGTYLSANGASNENMYLNWYLVTTTLGFNVSDFMPYICVPDASYILK